MSWKKWKEYIKDFLLLFFNLRVKTTGGAKPKFGRPDLVPSTPPNYGETLEMESAHRKTGNSKRQEAIVKFESPTHSSSDGGVVEIEDITIRTETIEDPFATEELKQKLREMDVKFDYNQRWECLARKSALISKKVCLTK